LKNFGFVFRTYVYCSLRIQPINFGHNFESNKKGGECPNQYLCNEKFKTDLAEPGEEGGVARPHESSDVSQQAETETENNYKGPLNGMERTLK